MIWTDGCEYTCTHWWYDSEDNDYEITAVWKFERGYDIPDSWHLIEIDLDYCDGALPNHIVDLVKYGRRYSGSIWCDIERQGPDLETLREVDYS